MSIHTLSARAVGRYAVEPSVSASRGLVVGFHGYGQDEAAMMEELQRLPFHHRDPFDRILVAQARVEGATLVSHDRALEPYGVPAIWT